VRTVGSLPTPWCLDPYLVAERADAELHAFASDPEACVLVLDDHPGRSLVGIGRPEAVARLLAQSAAAFAAHRPGTLTLERGAWEQVSDEVRETLVGPHRVSEWDWMWTRTPLRLEADPGVPTRQVERLVPGPEIDALVTECLGRAHPVASTLPGDPRLTGWWGVRDGDRLVATVGAVELYPGAPPHLVSLGVDPEHRGEGLAGAVLAAAVEDGLRRVPTVGDPMVHLGLYASNDVARRVYRRLGFTLEHRFMSVRETVGEPG
jgi:ribosomal protein S18 acetylase RimI-like enzyme